MLHHPYQVRVAVTADGEEFSLEVYTRLPLSGNVQIELVMADNLCATATVVQAKMLPNMCMSPSLTGSDFT